MRSYVSRANTRNVGDPAGSSLNSGLTQPSSPARCVKHGSISEWHIGNGRDPGPLANPAHYFIIIGLFGVFLAGGERGYDDHGFG